MNQQVCTGTKMTLIDLPMDWMMYLTELGQMMIENAILWDVPHPHCHEKEAFIDIHP